MKIPPAKKVPIDLNVIVYIILISRCMKQFEQVPAKEKKRKSGGASNGRKVKVLL